MKRFISIMLIAFMFLFPITIYASTYITNGNINVQGNLREVRPGTVVTLIVTEDTVDWLDAEMWERAEIDDIKYCGETIVDNDGKYQFNYFLDSNGRYKQYLKASGYKDVIETEFSFINAASYAGTLYEIFNSALVNIENPISELATILKDNETKLGLFDEIFSTYNDYTVSAKYLFDVLNGKNSSDFEEIEVSELIKKAVFLDLINNDADNLNQYIDWIYDDEEYADVFSGEIIDYLKGNNNLVSIEALETASKKAVILACVNNLKDSGALQLVLKKYCNLINIEEADITIDVCTDVIKDAPFYDVESLGSFVKNCISNVEHNTGSSSGGRGGSSSGGISHSYTGTTGIIEKTENVIEDISYFTDLSSVEWARESIENLFNKGIINGKSSRLYCPNDMITREEFVKILMSMYDIELVDDVTLPFDDVLDSAWYYSYVKSAYLAGVTNGMSETKFGIGVNVSRQDLCVMLIRFMDSIGKSVNEAQKVEFLDSNMISDYAQEAVGILSGAGVISGDENGKFNPLKNATRAEAAKIVNYAMNLFK